MHKLFNLPLNFYKTFPSIIFSLEHLLPGLYGVDAPEYLHAPNIQPNSCKCNFLNLNSLIPR